MATSLVGYNKSASGRNKHIVGCAAINRRQHYCICVNFLRAVEEERLGEDSFADCKKALDEGNCVAYRMRQEEKEAGVPIYFEERAGVIRKPESRPVVKTSYRSPGRTKPTKKVEPKKTDELIGANMADAITAAVKEETKPKASSPSYPMPKKGESFLEFALRFRGFNEAA